MKEPHCMSEDDIRTKIVYEWLKDCGINNAEIKIEYSINLRLGRSIKTIHSRSDILVTNGDGDNLLIIEVKRPDHILVNNDHLQCLSYARSLSTGGLAPYSILTNGINTKIFDSVTGEEITGGSIPANHAYVQNGFKVTSDALLAKAEALEHLITISVDNLLVFCKGQVAFRMKLLKSDDLQSGKKYIPQLYVERTETRKDLEEKLVKDNSPGVLVIGPPQHGKTCFLCNTAESFLDQGIACLFYPAIALKKGLLQEIQEDFQWMFKEHISPVHLIGRLQKILCKAGKKMVVFVDGWNEMLDDALSLNDECQRLDNTYIQWVISTTSPSLNRLLVDGADNLVHLAVASGLNPSLIQKLTTQPLMHTKDLRIVQVGKFNLDELQIGKQLYGSAYNVSFSEQSNLPADPFYLRLACEQYMNSQIPTFATRSALISNSLLRKGARRAIKDVALYNGLHQVVEVIIENDTPFQLTQLPDSFGSTEILSRWIESAILIQLNEVIPVIDFYYTHERDYSIAIIHRKLDKKFATNDAKKHAEEFNILCKTEAGKSALRWFLSCPEYCSTLENVFSNTEIDPGSTGRIKIMTDAILAQALENNGLSFEWLTDKITILLSINEDKDTYLDELSKLIFSLLVGMDKSLQSAKYEFWFRLLLKYDNSVEELGVEESYIHQIYGEDSIRSYDGYGEDTISDFDIDLFEKFLLDEDVDVVKKAAYFLAYVCPKRFLKKIPDIVNSINETRKIKSQLLFQDSLHFIIGELNECYYGSYCPGMLSNAEVGDDMVKEEFIEQKALWQPVLKFCSQDVTGSVYELLRDLARYVDADGAEETETSYMDPNQLTFDF